jgi:hypothetical protein
VRLGVAIMGAASKRSHKEGEVPTEDSLSRRMKPAAAAASTTPMTSATDTAAAALLPGTIVVTLVGSRSPCSAIVSNLRDTWP